VTSLAGEQYLNDTLIDYCLQDIFQELNEKDRNRTHIMSTFFYKRLTTRLTNRKSSFPEENDRNLPIAERHHMRVKRWTKDVDIFEKDFVMIPICEK